jgi:DNA-binding LacI/PurR family transcriptional regulator
MGRTNTVKMRDVAEKAGVSTMTVSLVLNGNTGNSRVSPETCQRVLDAVKELRYLPNARGRALRSGYTNIIGLYAGHGFINVRLPFFTEIVSGLQEGCEQVKKDLLLHGIFHGTTTEDIFKELADGRIDGIVLNMPPDDPLVKRIAESQFPAIAVADPLPGIPSVIVNDSDGSRRLAEYLYARGHRRLMYLACRLPLISALRRQQAFFDTAAALGMEIEASDPDSRPYQGEGFLTEILSRDASQRPTALVCWSDYSAYELLARCRRNGIRVPDDIAIVGFDGCSSPHDTVWSLTTVRAPWAEVARTAVLYLDTLLKGEPVPRETVLPVELIPGHTA